MSTFDPEDPFFKIIAHMLEDHGEFEIGLVDSPPEAEAVVICEIRLAGRETITWFDKGSPDAYQDYLSRALSGSKVLHITDSEGTRHIIRTDRILHVKVREINGEETPS